MVGADASSVSIAETRWWAGGQWSGYNLHFYFVLSHKCECDAEWLDQRRLTQSGWIRDFWCRVVWSETLTQSGLIRLLMQSGLIRDFWRRVVGSETSDAKWSDQRLLTQSGWIRDFIFLRPGGGQVDSVAGTICTSTLYRVWMRRRVVGSETSDAEWLDQRLLRKLQTDQVVFLKQCDAWLDFFFYSVTHIFFLWPRLWPRCCGQCPYMSSFEWELPVDPGCELEISENLILRMLSECWMTDLFGLTFCLGYGWCWC